MSKQNKQQTEWTDIGRLSLWGKKSKNGKSFLSGTLELENGDKLSVRLFKNENPKSEKSPIFYGFAQLPDFKASKYLGSDSSDADDFDVPF